MRASTVASEAIFSSADSALGSDCEQVNGGLAQVGADL